MGIYSQLPTNFVDTFLAASAKKDEKAAKVKQGYIDGVAGLVKAGAEGYNYKQRNDAMKAAALSDDPNDDEMRVAREKYVQTGDPSALLSLSAAREQALQNKELRESSEKATARENLTTAWKEAGQQAQMALYALQNAQNKYNAAKGGTDSNAMTAAETELKQAQNDYARSTALYNKLNAQAMKELGIEADEYSQGAAAAAIPEAEGGESADVKAVGEAATTLKEIENLGALIETDNVKIDAKQKTHKISEWNERIKSLENKIKNSNLSEDKKTEAKGKIEALRKKVDDYAKTESKGGQGVKAKPKTKEDYEAEISGLNNSQLAKKGSTFLKEAKKMGIPISDKVLKAAEGGL